MRIVEEMTFDLPLKVSECANITESAKILSEKLFSQVDDI
jgi:hypothetical protein